MHLNADEKVTPLPASNTRPHAKGRKQTSFSALADEHPIAIKLLMIPSSPKSCWSKSKVASIKLSNCASLR
jgi:hypothetical protein